MSEFFSTHEIDVFRADIQALSKVTLEVREKELVALIGPNGAGKSTLLHTISGLVRPTSGNITFLSKRIENLSPHQIVGLGISHVPAERDIFPLMTVMENLEMGAYLSVARKKMKEQLEFVNQLFPILKDRRNQLAGTLSGGEQQMLATARGLMSSPKLLMLDEPSLGLAPKVVVNLFRAIKKINEEGITVLLVEQNVHDALTIANRGYVLENGQIRLWGSSKELLESTAVKETYLGL